MSENILEIARRERASHATPLGDCVRCQLADAVERMVAALREASGRYDWSVAAAEALRDLGIPLTEAGLTQSSDYTAHVLARDTLLRFPLEAGDE